MAQTTSDHALGGCVLEIDGQPAGRPIIAGGGEPFAQVVSEPPDANGLRQKHIAPVEFAPLRICFGVGMAKPFYEWIAEFLEGRQVAKNGAIVYGKYDNTEKSRLEFHNARITELFFPRLETVALGFSMAPFFLTIQPEFTRVSAASIGESMPVYHNPAQQWVLLADNFRLKIAGLEEACFRANGIDGITVKQPLILPTAEEAPNASLLPSPLDIPNITFTVPESMAEGFYAWFKDFVLDGHNAPQNERSGTLEFFDPSMKTLLFTLSLSQVGICRIYEERSEKDAAAIARVGVEIYCERMAFASTSAAEGSAEADTGHRTSSNGGHPTPSIQAPLIARRLRSTTARPAGPNVDPKREDGIAIGVQWASEKATLPELEQLAGLESAEWTAVKLDSAHSMLKQLREEGVVPHGGDWPIDLERDHFVEGIVAGACQVYRSVIPHLSTSALNVGLQSNINGLDEKLNSVGDDSQLANVDLQTVLQQQQQMLQMMSQMAKTLNDTAMAVIRKIGG